MTYPQQQYAQPQYQQPGPQPQYGQPAPQGFQQPQYAPQQPAPQQGWGQPQAVPQQQYAPAYGQAPQQQGWGQPPAGQQPAEQPIPGSVKGFFEQPSTGYGPAWSWTKPLRPMGTTLVGQVARDIQDGDVEQQRQPNGGPLMTYRDGRPMLVMKVPMNVEPSQEHPEGKAQWYVQGQVRDELARAMKASGAPDGPPEAGAIIAVTWVSERRNNYNTMSKQYAVQYQRPDAAQPQAPQQQQAPPAQVFSQGPMPQQQIQAPAQQYQPQTPSQGQPPAQPPGQFQPAAAAQPQAPQQQVPNPFGGAAIPLGADNAALLAQLTGQQPAAAAS